MITLYEVNNLSALWKALCAIALGNLLQIFFTKEIDITDSQFSISSLLVINTLLLILQYGIGDSGLISILRLFHKKNVEQDNQKYYQDIIFDGVFIVFHAVLLILCSKAWTMDINNYDILVTLLSGLNVIWLVLKMDHISDSQEHINVMSPKSQNNIKICRKALLKGVILNISFSIISMFIRLHDELIPFEKDMIWAFLLLIRSVLDLCLCWKYYRLVLNGEYKFKNFV